jgi:predicted nucleotidyltransferase
MVVFPDKIEYARTMQELPEDLLTTDQLLYLTEIDGETQVSLMATLAQIAEEMLNEKSWFVALIPFWSRTKGLERDNSDFDIFLVGEENMWAMVGMLSRKIKEHGIDLREHIVYMNKSDYECTLAGMRVSEVGSSVLGIPLW